MIQIEHLTKAFASSETEHHALFDVSLTIEDGDIFGIIGSSGAGKSTLVRCINLLERPTSGNIYVDGNEITGYQGKQLLELRSSMGMIFQHFSLFQQRSALENVTFPLEIKHEPRKAREERARELLKLVGLSDKEESYPCQLSGGQQQRVAIARALANNPRVMLCDEATSALDTATTASILELLHNINAELEVTMVVITHSLAVTERICNKIAVLDKGRVVEQGATGEILRNPQGEATRELIEADTVASFHERREPVDACAERRASVRPASKTQGFPHLDPPSCGNAGDRDLKGSGGSSVPGKGGVGQWK